MALIPLACLGMLSVEGCEHTALDVGQDDLAPAADASSGGAQDLEDAPDLAQPRDLSRPPALQLAFDVRPPVPTTEGATMMLTADFNRDGRSDVVVGGEVINGRTVLHLARRDGAPGARTVLVQGAKPHTLAQGDFDGDGSADLLVASLEDMNYQVLLGRGDGTFQPRAPVSVAWGPSAFATADLNGDGRVDLSVATFQNGGGYTGMMESTGGGSFSALRSVHRTGQNPIAILNVDLNNDGALDWLVADQGSASALGLLATGVGQFADALASPTPSAANSMAVADFDGDTHLDLAVTAWGGHAVAILLGSGDGRFAPARIHQTGMRPTALATADFNLDGLPDVAVALEDGMISVLPGLGNGLFAAATDIQVPGSLRTLCAGDWNADGRPDLLTTDWPGNLYQVMNVSQ